jgi:alcohol dehydrogenase
VGECRRAGGAAWLVRRARALADRFALDAARVALERDAELRARRLAAAARDAVARRRRPARAPMRTLVLLPGGRLRWRQVPAPPPPSAREAVVHPIAVATCDMDRPMALGATPFPAPLHFGHECVAEVLSVGSEVTSVSPGQRVVVPFQISCGTCPPCQAGRTANCASVPPISMYGFGVVGGHWGGALSDELTIPFADGMLVPLPDGIDPAAAASVADNVGDGYRHIGPYASELFARQAEPSVLIVGAMTRRHLFTASVSLYAGLTAKALGSREVVVVDARPEIRDHAAALGLVAATPRELDRGRLFSLVADVSATPRGLAYALSRTAPDGRCSSSGTLHATARIPAGIMYGRNATVTIARAHARTLIPDVLALMTSGRLHPDQVTTALAAIDDAPLALTEHVRKGTTKTILQA